MEATAALLERAYRMALVLQGRLGDTPDEAVDVSPSAFEVFAVASELVAVLDEVRSALVVQAAQPRPLVKGPTPASQTEPPCSGRS